jgi:hypothetical protein
MRDKVIDIVEDYVRDNDYAGLQSGDAKCTCEPGDNFMHCKGRCENCYPITKEEKQEGK